jgi:putative hydrolase of the HAD superfamily
MTKDQSPEFFYFDLGNVLLSFDYDVAAAKMSAVCGASPETCRRLAYGDELYLPMERGELSPAEFHARFSELSGTTSDMAALLKARSDMFSPMIPTVRVVTQLKGVRHRIGLLSNTSPDHFEFCREKFGVLRELFDVYVLSYEVGAMKPDRKIYDAAIAQAGVPAERIFYVDDREENVAGAKIAGIDAVLFTGADRLLADLRARGVEMNL